MPSRRDQLQSYQFIVQRVVSAFTGRDSDSATSPARRMAGAAFGSVMIAVLALAGFGVVGLISSGGNQTWRSGEAVIIEKETGTRYVYQGGRLYPMANYVSALLVLQSSARTIGVSRNSLLGVPRGPLLGITGAPDALPPPGRLLGAPWTLCSQPGRDSSGGPVTSSVLGIGRQPANGRPLGEQALLVIEAGTNNTLLIWHDHRHPINDRRIVFEGLRLTQQTPVPVGSAWLNALPAGRSIGTFGIADRGKPSTAVEGVLIGQILVATGPAGKQYFLARATDLLRLTGLQAAILLADPATRAAYPAPDVVQEKPLSLATAGAARQASGPPDDEERAPPDPPAIAQLGGPTAAVCAAFSDAGARPRVLVDAALPPGSGIATPRRTEDGVALADQVDVAPGWGTLVEAVSSPDAPSGTLYLITDLGQRFALGSPKVPAMLGYDRVKPLRLPVSLVLRVPAGPALDPLAARQPAGRPG